MTTDLVTIHGHDIKVKAYNGKRVVTFADIDTAHERPAGTARRNFNSNRQRFVNGIDFFKVSANEIRTRGIMSIPNTVTEAVTFITEVGYMMLAKSFTDDLAWKVQRELVYSYFGKTEGVKEVNEEQPSEIYLEAARIMASVPYSRKEVVNCLKHLVPDIDAGISSEKSALPDKKSTATHESSTIKDSREFYKEGVPIDVNKLRRYMAKNGLNNNTIGKSAGLANSTISNIMNKKHRPTKKTKESICAALGKPLDWLDP